MRIYTEIQDHGYDRLAVMDLVDDAIISGVKEVEVSEERITIEFYKHGLSVPHHDERTFTLSEFREAVFNLLK